MSQKKDDVFTEAVSRLRWAKETRDGQLTREQTALRFQVPDLQWSEDDKRLRRAQVIDGVVVPPRPMLAIPKINQAVQAVLNQEKSAQLGVNVSPLSEDADDDTAEVIRDLYRRESQRSRAQIARGWAFDRAVKAGFGAYRITTEYDDESNNPFDQRIVWKRILNQDAVYLDPSAQEPDWSDGEWAFILTWLPHSKIKRQYPKAKLARYSSDELKALAGEEPDWVRTVGEQADEEPACLVAEYWRKQYTSRVWVTLDDGSACYADEVPEGRMVDESGPTRTVDVPVVVWSVLGAHEELDGPQEWNGQYIPIIPVIGLEVQPFDGERRWMGEIEPSMDGQKLFNYAASTAVELASLEPRAPYIMYAGQDEGYESMWAQANIRNFPALKINPDAKDSAGNPLPPPMRAQADVGKLGPSMMLLDQADRFLQATTSSIDQARIEQMGRRRVAHQTIQALQQQSDFGSSHYLYNLANVSMMYEAKVVIDLMAKIYDRPGRVARLLDLEDSERSVMLNAPFVMDPQTKRPMPAPEMPPDIGMQSMGQGRFGPMGPQPRADVKRYDLKKGRYGVSVTIGKSWQTRSQEASDEIGQILASRPELMPLIGPVYFKFRDFPGSREIADLLKKMRDVQFPNLSDDQQGQAAQQAAKLAQENQQLKAQLQEAAKRLEMEWTKHQAAIEVEKVKAGIQTQLAQIDAQSKIAIAEVQARVKNSAIEAQGVVDKMLQDDQQAHELAMKAAETVEARRMALEARISGEGQDDAEQPEA